MAGVIANFLAYDTIPWDMSDGKVAANAKQYLQDTANWKRLQGTKIIWNGVSEQDNPKKPRPPPANNPVTAGPPPASAPYAQGTCGIHVTEWRSPFDESGNYDLEVTMTDNKQAQIGYTQRTPASANNPLRFQSKLEDELVCVPELQNNYIAFALGEQQWPSDGNFAKGAIPSCTVPPKWSEDTGNEVVRGPPLHVEKPLINVQ